MTTKTKDRTFNWVGFISMLILIYFLYDQCTNYSRDKEEAGLVMALQDSLEVWQTKDSLNKARISALETEDIDQFLAIKSKDSTITHLQKVIADNKDRMGPGSSVTTGTTETKGSGTSTKTEVSYGEEKPPTPDCDCPSPTYFNEFDFDGWIWGSSLATKDSTTYDFNIKNKFDILIGEEKTGFLGFGRPKPFVEMTNHNPHTTTTELRTYKVSAPKPYNLVVGPSLGYGWGGWMFGVSAVYPVAKFRL